MPPRFLVLIAGLYLLIIACGGPAGTPIPTGTPVGSSTGQRLFVSNGCAACHGSDGNGSTIAPGLFEHSTDQISRQVRAPLGAMPTYPPLKISDEELDEIVLYISILEKRIQAIYEPAQVYVFHRTAEERFSLPDTEISTETEIRV